MIPHLPAIPLPLVNAAWAATTIAAWLARSPAPRIVESIAPAFLRLAGVTLKGSAMTSLSSLVALAASAPDVPALTTDAGDLLKAELAIAWQNHDAVARKAAILAALEAHLPAIMTDLGLKPMSQAVISKWILTDANLSTWYDDAAGEVAGDVAKLAAWAYGWLPGTIGQLVEPLVKEAPPSAAELAAAGAPDPAAPVPAPAS